MQNYTVETEIMNDGQATCESTAYIRFHGRCGLEMSSSNNRFESDGLPFGCAPGQAAAQAERSVLPTNKQNCID